MISIETLVRLWRSRASGVATQSTLALGSSRKTTAQTHSSGHVHCISSARPSTGIGPGEYTLRIDNVYRVSSDDVITLEAFAEGMPDALEAFAEGMPDATEIADDENRMRVALDSTSPWADGDSIDLFVKDTGSAFRGPSARLRQARRRAPSPST